MSLVGNLEELGLGEILQIVSLSKKTGVLFLSCTEGEGSVFFRQGQVVRASSSSFRHNLGEALIQKGVVDQSLLREALALQKENGFSERLGVILVKHFGLLPEIIEDVVRELIETVVFSLFAWSEGSFRFEVQGSIETVDGIRMDPLQFMLDKGLNPQYLAMEGTRILDEMRHAGNGGFSDDGPSGDEYDFNFDLVDSPDQPDPPQSTPHYSVVPQQVVIVDDDGSTLRAIADSLVNNGFVVHSMTRSEDALIMVDTIHRSGERPIVLIDLIMPKMDGSGVLGGVELLKLLHNNFRDLQLIVMTDYHYAEAENKVRDLGYTVAVKPRKGEINVPGSLDSFLDRLTSIIRHPQKLQSAMETETHFNLGDELRIELGEDDGAQHEVDYPRLDGERSLLQGMLDELDNPDLQGGVLLLVLRFASEFVNRAVVFTINNSSFSGLGQFGIYGGSISGDERVRMITVPRESDSMFSDALRNGKPKTFSPSAAPFNSGFFDQLGEGIPSEVFVGPITCGSQVIGFLYGDNLPGRKPIGDIEPLAAFLVQAGISLEKFILQRQLTERTNR